VPERKLRLKFNVDSTPPLRAVSSNIRSTLLRMTDQVHVGISPLLPGHCFFTSTQKRQTLWVEDLHTVLDWIFWRSSSSSNPNPGNSTRDAPLNDSSV
jgi:hypothetical protein